MLIAQTVYNEAQNMLKEIIANKTFEARAVLGIYPACSNGLDDIQLFADESRKAAACTLHTLRQQAEKDVRTLIDRMSCSVAYVQCAEDVDTHGLTLCLVCMIQDAEAHYFALADFVAPQSSGQQDYIGMFAVSCFGAEELSKKYELYVPIPLMPSGCVLPPCSAS